MRDFVFATVIAEIKNVFMDDVTDPELIELLYGGVAYPLGIKTGTVTKGVASKIVNREPGGKPLKVIRAHCQDEEVRQSIGQYFKQNIIRHFLPNIENDVIFRLRGIIKNAYLSDARKNELLQLGQAETFAEFLGQVYLASLLEENVITPERKQQLYAEMDEYKQNPLQQIDTPEAILLEERRYTDALVEVYAQADGQAGFRLEDIGQSKHSKHFSEQRRYYFSAEAVRRGTRDIYQKEDQFNLLKSETMEYVREVLDDPATSGMTRLSNVLKRAGELRSDRCWLFRDTDWIGISQKKGICHFLVNDGSIESWVRDDDGRAV